MAKDDENANELVFYIDYLGKIQFFCRSHSSYMDVKITYNEWHHLCLSRNTNTQIFTIFLDGENRANIDANSITNCDNTPLYSAKYGLIVGQE